ncbi:MAG: dTMP kinase [Clostridiales bacterium]|nr:dTMP kinase [Clostridiales bacterium]
MQGKFIVIDGLDGSGKTTQTKIIAEKLASKGIDAVIQAEPTGGEYGKMCREALSGARKCSKSQLALLFTADRIDHNLNEKDGINLNLNMGRTVISDRYYYSTLAYQGVDVGMNWLKSLNIGCSDIRKPDLCVFLDLAPEKSMERINAGRSPDEIEIYENITYLTSIRKRFFNVIEMLGDRENIVVINADGSVEGVASEIENAIMKLY